MLKRSWRHLTRSDIRSIFRRTVKELDNRMHTSCVSSRLSERISSLYLRLSSGISMVPVHSLKVPTIV